MSDLLETQRSSSPFSAELRLGDYIEIGWRRKWWIILCTLGCFVASVVVARRMADTYKAETVILVDSQEVPDKYVPVIVTADIAGRLSTLQQQVLSPTRLKKLVEAQGLYPEPTGKLSEDDFIAAIQKSITVEVVNPGAGKMAAFRIAYSSRNRASVAPMANEIAQMFIEENLKAREAQTEGTAQFLQNQLEDTKTQLDQKDEQLRAIKAHNIDDLPESKVYHEETLANLRGQAQGVQDKIDQDQRDKSILQTMLVSGGPAPTVEADNGVGLDGAALSPYQVQIDKLQQKLRDLRARYGPSYPEVRATQAELNRLTAGGPAGKTSDTPVAVDTNSKPELPLGSDDKHRNPVIEAQIGKLDEDIKQQTSLLQPIQARIEFHTSKLEQEPVFEQQIARLQQDYDSLKLQYSVLLDKKQAAEMSHALEVQQQGERFIVLDAAATPQRPAAPNRRLIALAGLMSGLLVGTALAAAVEMNDDSVWTEADAARVVGKPVLSGIPMITSPKERLVGLWQAVGMVTATLVVSVGFGFALSVLAGKFL